MNEQLDTILRDYKNGQKLDGSGDLYTIVDAQQSLLQLITEERLDELNRTFAKWSQPGIGDISFGQYKQDRSKELKED